MQHLGTRGAAHKARLARVVAGTLLLAGAYSASAQGTNPPAGSTDNAPSEAARRAAMSPYRFILQSSTAPRRTAPAPAPAAATEAKKPSPSPVQQASVQPSAPSETIRTVQPATTPAPEIVAAPTSLPAAGPAPESTVAALARKPAEPPARREIIPVRTDEPRLTPALMRESPNGAVTIEFDIQTDGSVGDVKVVSSSNRVLNRPTTDAVKNWKFQPVDEILTVRTEVVYNLER